MRITKKDIYAKHNITFLGDGYIDSPVGPIKELLKEGNEKTGKAVYTFSIAPGTGLFSHDINGTVYTVEGSCCCDCIGCYAKTGRFNSDIVLRSLVINTWLVNNHIDFVKRAIMAQLEILKRGEIRIHAAGDFNTKDPDAYAAMWLEIAKRFNTFRFWTYTKVKRFEGLFDGLKNANIVKSTIPKRGVNFGHCEYIINLYYYLKAAGRTVYICKCGIDKNQHCENCGVCATYEYVLFLEHRTEYKAEKDPLYNTLVDIVNNQ